MPDDLQPPTSSPPRLRAFGERSYLLEGLEETRLTAIFHGLEKDPPPDYAEAVPGYDNLLIIFKQPVQAASLSSWLSKSENKQVPPGPRTRIREVPVIYDGPDLESVARATGLSESEVVKTHSQALYRVRIMGFSPGFPYLDGLDPILHVERRASPRNRIEPGSVAIGGTHAGIYSVASPGGWHLLGRTSLKLFRPDKARGHHFDPSQVFALAPNDRLRFVAVDSLP